MERYCFINRIIRVKLKFTHIIWHYITTTSVICLSLGWYENVSAIIRIIWYRLNGLLDLRINRLNNFTFYYLKGQCPAADNLLVTPSACESWCCRIWSRNNKPFSKYDAKTASSTLAPQKQTLLRNTYKEEKYCLTRDESRAMRACVSTWSTCQSACVPTCQRACVPAWFTCQRAYVPTCQMACQFFKYFSYEMLREISILYCYVKNSTLHLISCLYISCVHVSYI